MLHQVMGGFEGQASDIEINAKHILRTKEKLNQYLAKATGQPLNRVEKDSDRDFYLSAGEAQAYGLIDEVLKAGKK